MELRIRPGTAGRLVSGFVMTFGWAGDDPALFIRQGGRFADGRRCFALTLPNAWRWRTISESRNGEDHGVVIGAALMVLDSIGVDVSDPSQARRQVMRLIDGIQHCLPELLAMPTLDMLPPAEQGQGGAVARIRVDGVVKLELLL